MKLTKLELWDSLLQDKDGARVAEFREMIVEKSYSIILQPGDIAVDLGAHRARHTVPMAAAVGAEGRVFAVEAATKMQKKLRAAVNRADVPHVRKIVSFVDFAMSDRDGTADFYYFPTKGSGRSSLLKPDSVPDDWEMEVETVDLRRLDDVLTDAEKVSFIKADIQGGEFHAMCGAKRVIQNGRPTIALENGAQHAADRFGYTKEDFFGLWDELDYTLVTVFGRPYDASTWNYQDAHDLFAIPNERLAENYEAIGLAIVMAAGEFI